MERNVSVSPAEIFRSGLFIATKGERKKERKKDRKGERETEQSIEWSREKDKLQKSWKSYHDSAKKDISPLSSFESITQFNKAASNQMQTKKIRIRIRIWIWPSREKSIPRKKWKYILITIELENFWWFFLIFLWTKCSKFVMYTTTTNSFKSLCFKLHI